MAITAGRPGLLRLVPATLLAAAVLGPVLLTTSAIAKCRPQGPQVTAEMVDAFVARPALLLLADATSPRDAAAMAVAVSQYVAADGSALSALLSVLPQASIDQRSAIGRGLYRAVDVCLAVEQSVAVRTATAVHKIGDATVVRAYRAAEAAGEPTGSAVRGGPQPGTGLQAAQSLIGDPVTANPMNLKLSDPFVMPEVH